MTEVKLKGNFGGPLSPEDVQEIEDMIPEINSIDYDKINLSKLLDKSQLIYVDLEEEYCSHTINNFDISFYYFVIPVYFMGMFWGKNLVYQFYIKNK